MKIKADYIFASLLSIVVFLCLKTEAQKPDIRFEYLKTEQGASQNTISAIFKDRYGYIWFATDDGLNKYDGYKVTRYRNNPKDPGSIGSNVVNCILEDSKGRLWIGVDQAGLHLFDRNSNSFTRFLHYDSVPSSLKDNTVLSICEDVSGNLWIGTNLGLDRMTAIGEFEHYPIPPPTAGSEANQQINTLFFDKQKRLWVGTAGTLAVLNTVTQNFTSYTYGGKDKNARPFGNIRAFTQDDEGTIWIGTENGLFLNKKVGDEFSYLLNDKSNSNSLSHNFVWALANEGNGRIWIGTESGLDIFETTSRQFFHYKNIPGDENSLPHNSVRSFYMDKGAVWLGSYAGGLRKYDRQLFRFGLYRPLISDPVTQNIKMVFSFAEMKNGDMLIGSDGGGLNIFHKKDKSFSHFDASKNLALGIPKEHAVLRLLVPQKSDGFWAGTYGFGLSHYNPATKMFTHYLPGKDNKHLVDASVFALMEDSKGNIWVGLNNGLNVFDPKTKTFSIIPTGWEPTGKQVSNLSIRCFYEMDDGKIWIGTHGSGISVYDPVTKTVEYIDKTNSHLSNNVVFSIYRDRKGNLWVGTMGGINLYNEKTKTFTAFTESNGLPNDYIASIQEDAKGNLWLSTKTGICCFNPVTKKVRNYGLENGLQAYEFLFGGGFTSSTGEIYFGGIDGFNVFDPATIPQNQLAPPVVITGFHLFNKPVTVGKNSPLKKDISIAESITLPFGSSMLSLEFAALNFTAPQKNQYAYKLEGFDKDWIYSGNNRVATYTNLDPGEYTFMVKASNNDGVWNEKGASIRIIITPPFWLTWWFKLIAGVLLLATVYAIYKIRMRSINQHREQLEKQVQERTQSLAQMTVELERKNKELEQFAYVASHDLQEPLRTISSFLDLLSKQYADQLDERAQKYMTFIVQASDRMKVLINDLLDYSRIGRKKEAAQVDLNKIVGEVLADLNKAITDAGAEIQVGKMPAIKAYPTELKQVFQNLILNAIKFRKKDTPPKIEIAAEHQNGEWKFMVRDNGIGIDPQHADRIFVIFQRLHTRNEYEGSGIGLSNCKKIAELHKGTIWVESVPGEGSSFFFTVKEMDKTLS